MSDNRICKFYDPADPIGSAGCCGRCHNYDYIAECCTKQDLVKEWMATQRWEDVKDGEVWRKDPDNSGSIVCSPGTP